jgi:hypothetical protein
MKTALNFTLLLLAISSLYSCGKERLTTKYQPVTINELTSNKPAKFTFQIDDTKIEEYGKTPGKFPIFGRLFKSIAKAMANASLRNKHVELDLPTTTVDLRSLLNVDLRTIDLITLDQLDVTIRDAKSKDNLLFLDKIEILAKLKVPLNGLPVDENGYTRIMYYDSAEKGLGCSDKCLVLNVEQVDWKKFLKENSTVEIKPVITVNSVPDSTMKLAGSIEFSVKYNVGF